MTRRSGKLSLRKETLRSLSRPGFRNAAGKLGPVTGSCHRRTTNCFTCAQGA
jgi:hypothetical protein